MDSTEKYKFTLWVHQEKCLSSMTFPMDIHAFFSLSSFSFLLPYIEEYFINMY